VIFAVLAVRVSDTHLHLCFDGHEAPASVHIADASVHHDNPHDKEGRADTDVNPFVGAFVKKADVDTDLALLAVVAVLGLLIPAIREIPSIRAPLIHGVRSPFWLRPPLRGPPL
jgi:hypothetical protein